MHIEARHGTNWRLEADGRLRLGSNDAIPHSGDWLYAMKGADARRGHPFIPANALREEVLAELATTVAPKNGQRLWFSLRHGLVLYPKYITPKDIESMTSNFKSLMQTQWLLYATLPLRDGERLVEVVIDSAQSEPLRIK